MTSVDLQGMGRVDGKIGVYMDELKKAIEDLYFAGYWHCDRPVDEEKLWEAIRIAADIRPGQTTERLGSDNSRPKEKA